MSGSNELDPREQLDLLVSRIADGEAGEADWSAFNRAAERRPEAWKLLAQAQRDHGAMSLAVGVALHAAERVELPSPQAAELFSARRNAPATIRTFSRMGAWSGWAVAACVAVMAWNGSLGSLGRGVGGAGAGTRVASTVGAAAPVQTAGWTLNTPDDAINAYLDLGTRNGSVIGELPTRPVVRRDPMITEDGQRGVRVVYIRQLVEQAIVTDLARLATDESGRLVPLPARPAMPLGDPQ